MPGQPFLELVVEVLLGLARLQVEEAQDQGAGEAEQRGAEGGAHAGERLQQAGLELVEDRSEVAGADGQAGDHAADRADRLDQAPEGAEQAKEDQQVAQVAGDVAVFVEPRADAVQEMAQGQGRERRAAAALALAQHGGDRGQQARRVLQGEAGRVGAERLDPARLGLEPQDPANIEEDAEQQDRQDDAVEPGIVLERGPDHLMQGADDRHHEDQEQDACGR